MTAALYLRDGGPAATLTRAPLDQGRDEKWLQKLIFDHPELLPIEELEPGAGEVVPLCRELALPGPNALVYLDLLGVTPRGRLVLVECKLWRNPQARREVVAQILEYAALLRRWTFADLTAKLKAALRTSAQNPIFEAVRARFPEVEEARFSDAVSRSLDQGAFDLFVAGDGIRSDVAAIAAHLNDRAGLLSRLALVEMQIWRSGEGTTLVVPHIPFRTRVVEHRVVVDLSGAPVPLAPLVSADTDIPPVPEPREGARVAPDAIAVATERAFWQRFIETVQFDHPDQPPPRHGGRNWVRIAMPPPWRWLTAYRVGSDRVGLFIGFYDLSGRAGFDMLREEATALREETGLDLHADVLQAEPFKAELSVVRLIAPNDDEDTLLDWLRHAANVMVSALRPRLAAVAVHG